MQVSKIQNVNFGAKAQKRETGGAGKAVASYFVPGLGEFLDGRNKSGAFFLASRVGVGVASSVVATKASKEMIDTFTTSAMNDEFIMPAMKKNKAVGLAALCLASIGLTIANVVDAYKGKKEPKTQEIK